MHVNEPTALESLIASDHVALQGRPVGTSGA